MQGVRSRQPLYGVEDAEQHSNFAYETFFQASFHSIALLLAIKPRDRLKVNAAERK